MKKKIFKKLKKQLIITVLFVCSISLGMVTLYAEALPNDIDKHWAQTDILSAASEGWAYLEGDKFNPNKAATREEAIWMLIGACKTVWLKEFSMENKADLSGYKDTPSPFAESRMAVALGNNIIKGYPDNTLKPKSGITRAEFAVMISRLINGQQPAMFSPFKDYIAEWALPGIKMAYSRGIIKGYTDGKFKPQNNVTKAEALVMINRWKNTQPVLAEIPAEFIQLAGTLNDVHIIKSRFDAKGVTIQYSKENGTYIVMFKNWKDKETIKEVLKTFYSVDYETAYKNVLNTMNNLVDSKELIYDERTFICTLFDNMIIVNVGKK